MIFTLVMRFEPTHLSGAFMQSRLFLFFLVLMFVSVALTNSTSQAQTAVPMVRMQSPNRTVVLPGRALQSMSPEMRDRVVQNGMVVNADSSTPTASAKPGVAPTDAERKTQMEARLAKLSELKFNRLPSHILETWSSPAVDSAKDPDADLPPAPFEAFLYSDIRFQIATKKLQHDFTLGQWSEVSAFLKLLPEANAKSLYNQFLQSATGSGDSELQNSQGSQLDQRQLQSQHMAFEDLFQLAAIAPGKIKDPELVLFGAAFVKSIAQGNNPTELVHRISAELAKEKPVFDRRQMAKILFQSDLPIPAGEFLPDLATAKQENDHEALNLLSRYYLAIHSKDKKPADLEQAWHVAQAILAATGVDAEQRQEALARAVQLSDKVSAEFGQRWLEESFVAQPAAGMEVLGAIGADTAKALQGSGNSPDSRLARLKLQNEAVNALLKVSVEQANNWRQPLNLLAQSWLREAQISYADDTSTQLSPSMRRDVFGNIFYYDDQNGNLNGYNNQYGSLQPIPTKKLLEVKPCEQWMAIVDDSLKPQFDTIQAQLYLKVNEQDLALPFIERLAKTHPDQSKKLIREFIEVWTRNHDMNSNQSRTNSYMFMYGFESRAESIPLTRSKQERNLRELAEMLQRLKDLSADELDEELLAKAFTTCHSSAEVYQVKAIETVFGSLEQMKPKAVASITNQMRANLATMWRDANVQKDNKTKRKKQEIEAEVIEGYESAVKIIADALQRNPNEWKLIATQAALLHDENNYRAELANSSEFSARRIQALALFQTAAQKYIDGLDELTEDKFSTEPFEQWFYASLGACDLALITEKNQADPKQPALIRNLLDKIPTTKQKWHVDRFANLLFNRLSSVKPELKFKYLDLGFEIVGDNEQAAEAKSVHDYYKDLVTEIKLETLIDGSDRVGNGQPFGVLVQLKHTKEIERESGGFGRYLQNQNGNMFFSYNYGRPTEDYRDKFDESVRALYQERFEVLSVTFQKPEVKSIPASEAGWRITPYAYLLLKTKGPEVDKLPPVKLDLDFLDTSGYAILPVESATIPIDAHDAQRETRPYRNLSVTQILDERQSSDGKLILEVKAQAQGLVPDLSEFLVVEPTEFEVNSTEEIAVAVTQFDPDENQPIVLSERNWVVSLAAKKDLTSKPKQFEFPRPTVELKEVVYQRYVDADLATVEPTIALEAEYVKTNYAKLTGLIAAGIAVFAVFLGLLIWLLKYANSRPQSARRELNGEVTPFAAISLLQEIYSNNGLSDSKKVELKASIDRLERQYFGQQTSADDDAPTLHDELKKWAR